jgi:hypothetical protein
MPSGSVDECSNYLRRDALAIAYDSVVRLIRLITDEIYTLINTLEIVEQRVDSLQ